MGKYLKMSEYFVTGTFSADYGDIHSVIKYKPSAEGLTCRAAHYAVEHAINSHDELVAEVERLRLIATKLYHDGVNFIGAEDLEDEEDAAEMQGRFNDTLIEASSIIGV